LSRKNQLSPFKYIEKAIAFKNSGNVNGIGNLIQNEVESFLECTLDLSVFDN
jgi:hypothetical protein